MSENPYASPAATSDIENETKEYRLRSLNGLALLITFAMAMLIASIVVGSVVETIASSMYPEFTNPNADVTDETEMSFVHGSMGLGLVAALANIGLIVMVCMFLYRANANLRVRGAELEHTPGWCAGWWFVPFMNLFKPYQCTKEIYQQSALSSSSSLRQPFQEDGTGLLNIWWTCWLIGSFLGRLETRLATRGIDAGDMALPLNWSSTVTLAVAGVCLVSIVRKIAKWQQ